LRTALAQHHIKKKGKKNKTPSRHPEAMAERGGEGTRVQKQEEEKKRSIKKGRENQPHGDPPVVRPVEGFRPWDTWVMGARFPGAASKKKNHD